ncbi:MAG: hypothetical protein M1814_005555 [Vezdaea aestivalis]|nr:MAG: hypothetical protein M1814_005555 [Vezdaea aestivalis]
MSAQLPPLPRLSTGDWSTDGRSDISISEGSRRSSHESSLINHRQWLPKFARRTLGIILLGITVFCWTASTFLASSIFADDTYSKPYFVCYVNTATFIIALVPIVIKHAVEQGWAKAHPAQLKELWIRFKSERQQYGRIPSEDAHETATEQANTTASNDHQRSIFLPPNNSDRLDLYETAKLSLEFCVLWFAANYFSSACLKYATVSSATILTSTSSVWTLIVGSITKVERFTIRKSLGVFASMAGIALISTVDLSGKSDEDRGSFPHKTMTQTLVGDSMALLSAVIYGLYTILMKKRIGDESRVNMPLFFGLVGLFNVLIMWPGLLALHFTGIEPFELPRTKQIWLIIFYNSAVSMFSDICWAYAMLLTSPLVVTLGLSMTIPLSLIGQMILHSQFSSALYWVGALIVLMSFLFINHESSVEEQKEASQT